MTTTTGPVAPRFRGPSASTRSQHLAGLAVVAGLVALALTGWAQTSAAILMFAVGAGAGYSLSGSV